MDRVYVGHDGDTNLAMGALLCATSVFSVVVLP
jgi:hypothetical protein